MLYMYMYVYCISGVCLHTHVCVCVYFLIHVYIYLCNIPGTIWARYSLVIIPKNYNLFAVNVFVGLTGFYQLYRIWE